MGIQFRAEVSIQNRADIQKSLKAFTSLLLTNALPARPWGRPFGQLLSRICLQASMCLLVLGCDSDMLNLKQDHQASDLLARPLSSSERMQDFEAAVRQIQRHYAPLLYKQKRFDFEFDKEVAKLASMVDKAEGDREFEQVIFRLAALFRDGHVSVQLPHTETWRLPLGLDWIEGQLVVDWFDSSLKDYGIRRGDVILSVDGLTPKELFRDLSRYFDWGSDAFNKRLWAAALARKQTPFLPNKPRTRLHIKRMPSGEELTLTLAWKKSHFSFKRPLTAIAPDPSSVADVSQGDHERPSSFQQPTLLKASGFGYAGLDHFGRPTPFFAKALSKKGGIQADLSANDPSWKAVTKRKRSWQGRKPLKIYARLFKHKDKHILLVRVPSYSTNSVEFAIASYTALLQKYQTLADVLVLDQTHNPGGDGDYVMKMASLFLKTPGPDVNFAPRADRLWLRNLKTALEFNDRNDRKKRDDLLFHAYDAAYQLIDEAHDRGDHLAPPMSLRGVFNLPGKHVWQKPILMLIDDLCVSSGDVLPLILKGHRRATLFGNRTAGFGGNVEAMSPLPNSGITLRLTRSFFYLSNGSDDLPERLVENEGVKPDIAHSISRKDFADGFKAYVEAFSSAAVKLIE